MVELSREECEAVLSNYTERLSPAAFNGPNATVISGEAEAMIEVIALLEQRGVACRRMNVDVEVTGMLRMPRHAWWVLARISGCGHGPTTLRCL